MRCCHGVPEPLQRGDFFLGVGRAAAELLASRGELLPEAGEFSVHLSHEREERIGVASKVPACLATEASAEEALGSSRSANARCADAVPG